VKISLDPSYGVFHDAYRHGQAIARSEVLLQAAFVRRAAPSDKRAKTCMEECPVSDERSYDDVTAYLQLP
jgi:hypothetical protein